MGEDDWRVRVERDVAVLTTTVDHHDDEIRALKKADEDRDEASRLDRRASRAAQYALVGVILAAVITGAFALLAAYVATQGGPTP